MLGSTISTAAVLSIVAGVNGLDYNPGSDADTDIITVGVTGIPRVFWDESADAVSFTKGIQVQGDTSPGFILKSVGGPAAAIRNEADNAYLPLYASVGVFLTGLNIASATAYIQGASADNNYLDLQAFDVDGAAWASVIRIQNANAVELGFYGATPVAQQTGVAVDAAGIHAALVNLGLITA